MDYYLSTTNCVNRLVREWKTYKKLIIAVDFDGTIYDTYGEGRVFNDVINLLKRCAKIGAYFIVFTCRRDDEQHIIIDCLNENNLPYDKINDNVEFTMVTGRKVYYNIFLDDRAGLLSAYEILSDAVTIMEKENNIA